MAVVFVLVLVLLLLLLVLLLLVEAVLVVAVVLVRDFVFFLVLLNNSKKRVCPGASDDDDDDDFDATSGLAGLWWTLAGGLMLSFVEDKAFLVDTASVGDDAEGLIVKYFRIESWGGEGEAATFLLPCEPSALVLDDMVIECA